jgi:GNAT superfamily N-acetyltransferase
MGPNGGLDLGSFRFRDRLFDLDERNGGTKILVQGYDSLHFHTLFSCFPPCKLENLSKQNERNIRIKRLEKEQVDDYLAFFDRISSGSLICYCAHLHRTKEEEETSMLSGVKGAQALRSYLREEGRRFVLEGRIRGYLVYRDGQVIGWCQAKDKTGYHYLRSEVRPTDNHEGEVIAISCLVIEEEYQNQGIASVLMDYIADDARNRGYQRLEAYPGLRCLSEKEFETMVRFY